MTLIWATRGREWGFRFLRDGGLDDPLPVYDEAFAGMDAASGLRRGARGCALRFPDPEGRRDRSGRVIPHDFVLLGADAEDIGTLEDGMRAVWPRVAEEFARVWRSPEPPSAATG